MTTINYLPTDLLNLIGEYSSMKLKVEYYKENPDKIKKVIKTEYCCMCGERKVVKRLGRVLLTCGDITCQTYHLRYVKRREGIPDDKINCIMDCVFNQSSRRAGYQFPKYSP